MQQIREVCKRTKLTFTVVFSVITQCLELRLQLQNEEKCNYLPPETLQCIHSSQKWQDQSQGGKGRMLLVKVYLPTVIVQLSPWLNLPWRPLCCHLPLLEARKTSVSGGLIPPITPFRNEPV